MICQGPERLKMKLDTPVQVASLLVEKSAPCILYVERAGDCCNDEIAMATSAHYPWRLLVHICLAPGI